MTLTNVQNFYSSHPPAPYNTDLAPSDYHMFGPLIEALGGRRFATDGVKDAVHAWLRSQQKNFFANWIRSFVIRYTIYVEKKMLIVLSNGALCICHRFLHKK